MWQVDLIKLPGSGVQDAHVYPLGDLVVHELTRMCWCNPSVGNSINNIVQVVHNSADGRELLEAKTKAEAV